MHISMCNKSRVGLEKICGQWKYEKKYGKEWMNGECVHTNDM